MLGFHNSHINPLSVIALFAVSLMCNSLFAQPPHIKKMLEEKKKAIPAAPVIVAPAVEDVIQGHTWYSGNLVSRNAATLAPESDGKVLYVAEAGEYFTKGDVLVQLDDTLLMIALTETKASIKNYSAQTDFLKRETSRFLSLLKKGNVSLSAYEKSKSKLRSVEAMLEAAVARVQLSEEQIVRMKIKAPFDGVVSARYSTKGEWVKSGDQTLDFVDLQQLEIVTNISAKDLPFVQVDDSLRISLDSARSDIFSARVRSVVPTGDIQSRLFRVRLAPPPKIGLVGQLVHIAVPNSYNQNVTLVPEDALVIRGEDISVFKVGPQMSAIKVSVKTGISKDGLVAVNGLINPGDKVIIRGNERLFNGMPVRFLTKSPAE